MNTTITTITSTPPMPMPTTITTQAPTKSKTKIKLGCWTKKKNNGSKSKRCVGKINDSVLFALATAVRKIYPHYGHQRLREMMVDWFMKQSREIRSLNNSDIGYSMKEVVRCIKENFKIDSNKIENIEEICGLFENENGIIATIRVKESQWNRFTEFLGQSGDVIRLENIQGDELDEEFKEHTMFVYSVKRADGYISFKNTWNTTKKLDKVHLDLCSPEFGYFEYYSVEYPSLLERLKGNLKKYPDEGKLVV